MAAANALVRLFSTRSSRLLSSRNVTNYFLGSARCRSVFAATTRGASQNPRFFIPCACSQVCACGVHKYTQADSELLSFLKKEINQEKDKVSKVSPSMQFEAKVVGTHVTLEREYNAEKIILRFDVNENTNQDEGSFANVEENDDSAAVPVGEIVSYPSFTVEIIKKTGHTLKFYCEFNSQLDEAAYSDSEPEDMEEEQMLQIINVSVTDTQKTGQETTVYNAETENMDSSLYIMLLNMLAERGVNEEFSQWLLSYSTALEQQQYIKFLEDLNGFVKLQ